MRAAGLLLTLTNWNEGIIVNEGVEKDTSKGSVIANVTNKDGTKKRYKIEYDREACIGAAACVAAYPERWVLADDGKADVQGGTPNEDNSVQTLEFGQEEFDKFMESAQACPVTVIHIIDLETGERLI